MRKILITGYKGFIGNNLYNYLKEFRQNECEVIGIGREVDLFDPENVKSFLLKHDFDIIIHCAIEGGSRHKKDDLGVTKRNLQVYKNIRMNFLGYIINMSSGAEFDVRNDILEFEETMLTETMPMDPYGISKNMIARINHFKGANLRIFNVFAENENNTRFITSNIRRYINNQPMVIHQDKWFDFFYIKDLYYVLDFVINNIRSYDLNMSYKTKYKLSDICNIINNLSDNKVDINIETQGIGNSYTGSSVKLYNTIPFGFIGLEQAISEIYNILKNEKN